MDFGQPKEASQDAFVIAAWSKLTLYSTRFVKDTNDRIHPPSPGLP